MSKIFIQNENPINNSLNYAPNLNPDYNHYKATWDNFTGNVTTVGSNGGSSYYGTYDQGGNVSEWLEAGVPIGRNLYYDNAYLRGGSFFSNELSIQSSADVTGYAASFNRYNSVGFRIATINNALSLTNFVLVNDSNNIANPVYMGDGAYRYLGAINYNYYIGIYEITNNEYIEFLNAIANTDTYNVYHINMATQNCGIIRSGLSGNYIYSIRSTYGNKPVIWVSWLDAARYCNWLHNGKPSGSQNNNTTEDGAYTLNGKISGNSVVQRNVNASYYIPHENEWYKAAYYKGGSTNAGYWLYPTKSDSIPYSVFSNTSGDGKYPKPKIKINKLL